MQRIVINNEYGGFHLSACDALWLTDHGHEPKEYWSDIRRDDPILVEYIMSGACPNKELIVVEIPDDIPWHIDEYDGYEVVHENHRTWGADAKVSP